MHCLNKKINSGSWLQVQQVEVVHSKNRHKWAKKKLFFDCFGYWRGMWCVLHAFNLTLNALQGRFK